MSKSISNLKVVVADEIFDFRCLQDNNPNLKDKTLLLKETDNCQCNETLLNCSPLTIRLKRPRQKPRSRTADPRFRRSRSPHHQQMCITQSSDTINKSLEVNINKSSSSSPTVNQQSSIKKGISRNPEETLKNESSSFVTERALSFVEGEGSGNKTNYGEILNSFSTEANLAGSEVNYDDLNSLVTEDEEPVNYNEHFKPYWEDPRYTKNCNCVRINTLPLLPKVPDHSGGMLCQISQCNKDISSYKYDQGSEIYSCSLVADGCMQKRNVRKDYEIFYCLLCSIMGIIIASFIVYFILNVRLELEDLQKEQTKYEGITYYFNYVVDFIKGIFTRKTNTPEKKHSLFWLIGM